MSQEIEDLSASTTKVGSVIDADGLGGLGVKVGWVFGEMVIAVVLSWAITTVCVVLDVMTNMKGCNVDNCMERN